MKAVVVERPGALAVRDIPRPTPRRDEVLVQIAACGICGSDVRYLHGDNPWAKQTLGEHRANPQEMVLGHELAGTIVEVGDESLRERIGQRVAVLAYRGCAQCVYCRNGRHNLCGEVEHIGHSAGWDEGEPNPGGMAEYCRVWNEMAFDLPDHLTFEQATFLDALGVSVHACRRGAVGHGESVCIIGSGTVGLLIMQLAKLSGARRVVCCDTHPTPLTIAEQLGADACVPVAEDSMGTDLEAACGEHAPNVVFDSVGSRETVDAALRVTARGGRVVLLAMSADAYELPWHLLTGERTLTTSANNCYPEFQVALDLLSSGRIVVDPIITHRFALADAPRAFEVADRKDEHGAVKVLLLPGKGQ